MSNYRDVTKTELQQLDDFALRQRAMIAIDKMYRVPGRRKWFLYVIPILENMSQYKANRHRKAHLN